MVKSEMIVLNVRRLCDKCHDRNENVHKNKKLLPGWTGVRGLPGKDQNSTVLGAPPKELNVATAFLK